MLRRCLHVFTVVNPSDTYKTYGDLSNSSGSVEEVSAPSRAPTKKEQAISRTAPQTNLE